METLDRIAATLVSHQVNFVVMGLFGAQLHGVEMRTQDADMAYQRTEENHRRLLAALGEMDAHIRRSEDFLIPLPTDAPGLLEERDFWRLRTIYGDVDSDPRAPGRRIRRTAAQSRNGQRPRLSGAGRLPR